MGNFCGGGGVVGAPGCLTGVIEKSLNESAISKIGAHCRHIVEVAILEGGTDESDRLELHADKPGWKRLSSGENKPRWLVKWPKGGAALRTVLKH